LYKDGVWYLDWNGNGAWDNGVDKAYSFGAPGWIPKVGDWNGDGRTKIGVTNGQQWYFDSNANGSWDTNIDYAYSFGAPGWTPVLGKWNSHIITGISPIFTYGIDVPMTIIGTNFQQGFTAKMTKSEGTTVVVEARDVTWDSATQVRAWFTLPTPRQLGTYTVIVTNPAGSTCSLENGFEVK
jgi:hypothetical protein